MPSIVPTLPVIGTSQYRPVEVFAVEFKDNETMQHDWTHEDLGRLTRLAADIRADISFLEDLAGDIAEITMAAVECDRARDMEAVA
jgi:hypothetical protein